MVSMDSSPKRAPCFPAASQLGEPYLCASSAVKDMHLLLKKVTLYEDHLDLDIRTAGVEQILEELDYEDHD